MMESKNKLFLCNRWFYLIKENEDTLFYSTSKDDKNNKKSVRLEFNKKDKTIKIIYLKKQRTLGIIEISDITSYPIYFYYKQLECDDIIINNEMYNNLLIELFTSKLKDNDISKQIIEVCFSKKKKMNSICYKEPEIPYNEKINIDSINTDASMIKEFRDVVDTFYRMSSSLGKYVLNTNNQEESTCKQVEEMPFEQMKRIVIPQEIVVYDRKYHLVGTKNNSVNYENKDCGIYNLIIGLDFNNKELADIKIKIKKGKQQDGIIKIYQNEQKEIVATLSQRNIKEMGLNQNVLHNANIKSTVVHNNEGKITCNEATITSEEGNYFLERHPNYTVFFTNEEGILYSIKNSDYDEYSSIISYSQGIFHSIEKKLIKKDTI